MPEGHDNDAIRSRILPVLRPALELLGTIAVAWFCVLLADWLTLGRFTRTARHLPLLATLAATYAALTGLALAVAHGLTELLARRLPPRVAAVATSAALGIYPALTLADYLASGDKISRHPSIDAIWAGFVAGATIAVVTIWLWHVAAVRPGFLRRGRARRRWVAIVFTTLWALFGLGFSGAVLYKVATDFHSRITLALFLLAMAPVPVGTLLHRGLSACGPVGRRIGQGAGVVALLVLGVGAVVPPPDDVRAAVITRARLSDLTNRATRRTQAKATGYDLSAEVDCSTRTPAEPPPALDIPAHKRRNVILISVDALRRDVIYEDEDGTPVAPNLRAFAEHSIDFRRAVTTYPATLLAVGGAVSGRTPAEIMMSPQLPEPMFDELEDLFDYTIIVWPTSSWFKLPVTRTLLAGTQKPRYMGGAPRETRSLLGSLGRTRKRRKNIFAWIHYFEPHKPYRKKKGFDFGKRARGRYLSEVAYTDNQFGKLIEGLEKGGWFEDSLIIVFADHGQALGENRYWGHHVYLNAWLTDIPLLLHYPGVEPGVSDALVDITDIYSTVMHFMDQPPHPDSGGTSLFLAEEGDGHVALSEAFPIRGRALFKATEQRSESSEMARQRLEMMTTATDYAPRTSLTSATHRLIIDEGADIVWMYDREADPRERDNLVSVDRERSDAMLDAFKREREHVWQRIMCPTAVEEESADSDAEATDEADDEDRDDEGETDEDEGEADARNVWRVPDDP